MNVLLLTTSPRGSESISTRMATELAQNVTGASHQEPSHLVVRDLVQNPLPHISPDFVLGMGTPEAERTAAQQQAVTLSDRLIAELQAADVVVIAAGMINFGVPSTLKAWIDHIARAGVTFRYGANGPEGLVTGKKAVLVLSQGGVYSSGPAQAMDHMEPYLRHLLGFIGLTDIETIRIEGLAMGPEAAEKTLAQAATRVQSLAQGLAVA
ncbi:MAG: FMN-dependent NADH-azoreductase [Armatimonas sp.]